MEKQLVFKTKDDRFNIYKGRFNDGDPFLEVNGEIFEYYEKQTKLVTLMQKIKLSDEITKPKARQFDRTAWIVDLDEEHEFVFSIRPKTKEYFQALNEVLGVAPRIYLKAFNFYMYDHMVAGFDNFHVKKLCFNYPAKKLCPSKVRSLNNISATLDQLKKDNIYHLAPVVFKLRKDPSDLKKEFGKGAWKKITKNSFSRNNLLMRVVSKNPSVLNEFNTLPSSLLKYVNYADVNTLRWIEKKMKGKWNDKREVEKAHHIFHDTRTMAGRLGEPFDLNWTPEEMQAAHDQYMQQVISGKRKADNIVFDHYNSVSVKTYSKGDFEATYLKTADEIHYEGEQMHHCVGGYASFAKRNEYMVYHITFKGEKYSTLGVTVTKNTDTNRILYTVNQHYTACNQPVSPEAAEFAQEIVTKLNKPVDKLA